jgi:hypothetical protein
LGAPIIEAEDQNANMISDKLHGNDTNLRRRFQQLDQFLSNKQVFKQAIKLTQVKLFYPRTNQFHC